MGFTVFFHWKTKEAEKSQRLSPYICTLYTPGSMKVAILISTYQSAATLHLIFKALSAQHTLPDEILIAEDGQDKETQACVSLWKPKLPTILVHCTQADEGFRKALILNKAVAQSTSDYIVQMDGDCLPPPFFIADHIAQAKKGRYLYGTRVHIREKYVPKVIEESILNFSFFNVSLKKRFRALRLPLLQFLFREQPVISPKFRGCNVSFWRDDFVAVNGYETAFTGWGREDSELIYRFHFLGIRGKRLKFSGQVYHLDHPEKDRSFFEANDALQNATIASKKIKATQGLDQLC